MLDFGIYTPEQMLLGRYSPMTSRNCCIVMVRVKQIIVSARRDVTMQTLKHVGNLFCVHTVDHRAFTLNLETWWVQPAVGVRWL